MHGGYARTRIGVNLICQVDVDWVWVQKCQVLGRSDLPPLTSLITVVLQDTYVRGKRESCPPPYHVTNIKGTVVHTQGIKSFWARHKYKKYHLSYVYLSWSFPFLPFFFTFWCDTGSEYWYISTYLWA